MSIKTQKILAFVPIANLIPLYISMIVTLKNPVKLSEIFKEVLKTFAVVILLCIPIIILEFTVESAIVHTIKFYVLIYLFFSYIVWLAVKEQEIVLRRLAEQEPLVGEK